VLLLLAKGWFITRRELPFTESQGLLISVGALVGIFTIYQVLQVRAQTLSQRAWVFQGVGFGRWAWGMGVG